MSSEEHKCPICGKPTSTWYVNARKDGLCREHAQMLKEGKLVQCPDCGKYHLKDEKCECKKEVYTELPREGFENCIICNAKTNGYAFCKDCYRKHTYDELLEILNKKMIREETIEKIKVLKTNEVNKEIKTQENNSVKSELKKGKCLTCNNTTTDDYLFCPECYHKYKNKTLLLKVEKCLSIEILDESYEGVYGCDDGHIVKSIAEREIDDYLYANSIKHSYEPLYGNGIEKGKKPIKPDFLLENYLGPNEHVYLEYWGFDESYKEYTERKNYKLSIYKKNKDTVISLSAKKDVKYLKFSLQQKLKKENIEIHKINED